MALPAARSVHGLIDFRRHLKGRIRPTDRLARERDFLIAQGFAVHLGGPGTVGTALADHGAGNNQSRLFRLLLGFGNGTIHGINIMTVHRTDHVPAIGFETTTRIVAHPALDITVNRNAVVVVDGDELVEPPHTSQGAALVADALHHAAVAQEHIGTVVDHGEAFTVKLGGEHLFGQRHTDAIGDALTERPGRRFHVRRHTNLRMSRGFATHLTEVFDALHQSSGHSQSGAAVHTDKHSATRGRCRE